LIAMQKPDATLVAGFNTWKNKFGRSVNKGEKGIQILAPAPFKVKREMEKINEDTGLPLLDNKGDPVIEEVEVTIPHFKAVPVFDVSQTDGKELPSLADELKGGVTEYEKLFDALKATSPVPIEFEKINDGSKGYYSHTNKKIAINEDMSQLQTVKTAIHEIVHAKLHDRDLVKADLAVAKDKNTMEVEAESIAYTVCQHFGIDTSDYSFGYIAAWGSGKELPELRNSLETIRSTASEIITTIETQMRDFDKNLAQTQEAAMPVPETPEKAERPNIIGNVAFKDIADKKYFKIDNYTAEKIQAGLEESGVKFSGRVSEKTTTFTVDAADVAAFREVEKAANAHKIPPPQVENTEPQAVSATPPEKPITPNKSGVIGTVKFTEIDDKKYMKMDTAIALAVAAELKKQGFKFSGRVSDDKTTLTVHSTDLLKCRAIAKEVKAAFPPAVEPVVEQKAAEKLPDITDVLPDIPSNDYNFSILQLKDIPETRSIRFEPLQSLEDQGITLTTDNYHLIYQEPLSESAVKSPQLLEDLYTRFNNKPPNEFTGHSLSVSDVVVIQNGDDMTAHYCDRFGFAELPPEFIVKLPEMAAEVEKAIDTPEKREYPKVYEHDYAHAVENNERDKYHESRNLCYDCAFDLERTIRESSVPEALEGATKFFGEERVNTVLAHVITANPDGITPANVEWAKTVDVPKIDHVPLNVSPEVLNELADLTRGAEPERTYPPVYYETAKHAAQNDERPLYRESMQLNEECAAAIDKAISASATQLGMPGAATYDFDTALKEVTAEFGTERVNAVLAVVVNENDWDGRLSDTNKEWAKNVDVPQVSYIEMKTHLAVLDGFVNHVRKTCEVEREQMPQVISPTKLAAELKAEQPAPDKPKQPRPKKSIKGRIEDDKVAKREGAKSEPQAEKATQKKKGETEL